MFEIQVRVWTAKEGYTWKSVRPNPSCTGRIHEPYKYETETRARRMLEICYPNYIYGEEVRVIKVEDK